MNWRFKAAAQQLFSRIPGGGRLNRLMQEKVTHSLPAPSSAFDGIEASAEHHLAAVMGGLRATDPADLHGYEFGAGWHLGVAVALARLGIGVQTLVDREPLANADLVNHTISVISDRHPYDERLACARSAGDINSALGFLGIDYRAPVDACRTALPTASFDFITSTSTLEHIPDDDLDALVLECHRVLKPGGVFSAMVDYGDHYASFDPSITRLNFLRYSPRRWRVYSPLLHFQSRLRHSDYLGRIEAAGFELVDVSVVPVAERDSAWVGPEAIDASFHRYDAEDLVIGDSHIVAVKRP